MTRIAIIGTGAVGARHLQALARISDTLQIHLVDPSSAARKKAVALLTEVSTKEFDVSQWDCIKDMRWAPDIAIVATNARERLAAVLELCSLGCPTMILEKILFTQLSEYKLAQAAIQKSGAKVWVNCALRTAPRFHRLHELIAGRPIAYQVEGHTWGMASNVIHHLDEWLLLARTSAANLRGIFNPELMKAKRAKYFEVTGEIVGTAGLHSFRALNHEGFGLGPRGDRVIRISFDDVTLCIGMSSQDLLITRGSKFIAREAYPTVLLSDATSWHVASILSGGEPSLPRFEDSAPLHVALLEALLPHFQLTDPNMTECPIT